MSDNLEVSQGLSTPLSLENLLSIKPATEPPGFKDFWEQNFAIAQQHELHYQVMQELWSPDPERKIYELDAQSVGGVRIVLWIVRPRNSCGGLLIGQGYGHNSLPELETVTRELTTCQVCVRGLGLSHCFEIPWDTSLHILHGIDSKEHYILRGAIFDQWIATNILLDMFPDTRSNLNYQGSSMGGGMGALMLPWDKRFKAAWLNVPTFGASQRFKYSSSGSSEACRQYISVHPEALEVLNWFDASCAARYLDIPVAISTALNDSTVPPVGQFSIANSISALYKQHFILDVGHAPATLKDQNTMKQIKLWRSQHFMHKS